MMAMGIFRVTALAERLRNEYPEFAAFAEGTGDADGSAVLFNHGLGIVEAQPITFDIVDVAGGDAVEFVKYVLLFVRSYPYAVVFDAYFNAARSRLCPDYDIDGISGIFDGVFDEVANDIPEMKAVCVDNQVIFCLDMEAARLFC